MNGSVMFHVRQLALIYASLQAFYVFVLTVCFMLINFIFQILPVFVFESSASCLSYCSDYSIWFMEKL
jgi:hypothetical protein